MAFKNSSGDSGISVISLPCVEKNGKGVCEHIQLYYKSTVASPVMSWIFEDDILPDGCELEQNTSESGDECHYNIKKITNKDARKIIVNLPPSDIQICNNNKTIPFSEELL